MKSAQNEKVGIFCHQPCSSSKPNSLLWNAEEVLALIREYPVAIFAAGHDHGGFYGRDSKRTLHHIVPAAPIECAKHESAYGYLDIRDDRSGADIIWTGEDTLFLTHFPRYTLIFSSYIRQEAK
jgi:hypothetical protein